MNLLLDPNVAYLLLLAGSLLGLLAVVTPGTGLLEIGTLFCLVLAGYAITQLEFNLWALIVLVVSLVPFFIAIQKPKREWALALSILGMVVGSVYLFRNAEGGVAVNPLLAVPSSLLYAGFIWIATRKTLQALHLQPTHNMNMLVGKIGETRTSVFEDGSVQVSGELWSARSKEKIPAGTHVKVVARDGFILEVETEPEH